MAYLERLSIADLHEMLDAVEGKRATQRLLAGISYKDGVDQQTIAHRHGVHRNTVRNWLQRLDTLPEASLEEAVYDSAHPGRPRALEPSEFEAFVDAVSSPAPVDVGEGDAVWTPERARDFIESTFGVEYSTRHVRRLLSVAGRTGSERLSNDNA